MTDKMHLIERLIKDGSIGLEEALILMETEKEQVFIQPCTQPLNPYPNTGTGAPYWWQFPTVTCGLTVGDNVSPLTIHN